MSATPYQVPNDCKLPQGAVKRKPSDTLREPINFSPHVGNFRCRLCFIIGWSLRGKGNASDIMTGSRTMRVSLSSSVFLVLLLCPVCFSQLPSFRCDSTGSALKDCSYLTKIEIAPDQVFTPEENLTDRRVPLAAISQTTTESQSDSGGTTIDPEPTSHKGFHWGRALTESATFLVIEQAYVVHTDFSWVISENGIPFNHYWRDYMQSLSEWTHSGWNDGDPNWFGYVGHPIQGALTGFIQIQNDPRSETLEFSRTKAYWWSRLKAGLWNAAYSTQWNLGPVSEVTVEKYGTKDRPPWNYNGSFPCSHHCLTGVGQIDIVMTPLGGTGWLIGEDFLDSKIVRRLEYRTQNRLLIDTVRVALNPIRGGANVLHGKPLWYRASRDSEGMPLASNQKTAIDRRDGPKTKVPDHGDVFFGYTHVGTAHCETLSSGTIVVCDPLSAKNSNLNGWNLSLEKKYLRYFGGVADFSGQYGGATQNDILFGLRGGAPIGRLRPFAEALIGAVHVQENNSTGANSGTSFAEALGVGVDFRLVRLLGWRFQVDEIKTGSPAFERRNLRVASGLAVRF
jgi:hypothetical protein